jgi:hypothetical protein
MTSELNCRSLQFNSLSLFHEDILSSLPAHTTVELQGNPLLCVPLSSKTILFSDHHAPSCKQVSHPNIFNICAADINFQKLYVLS